MTRLAVAFRWAGPDDVGAVLALVESAYRGDPSRKGWTTEADYIDGQRTDAEEIRSVVDGPHSRILLATVDGRIEGSCQLARQDDGSGYFGMFAVRPEGQGAGVGAALLAEAERLAAAWGAVSMALSVVEQREELIAWYERRGYRRTGEYRPFPYGDPRYGVPRVPDLCFAMLEKPFPPA